MRLARITTLSENYVRYLYKKSPSLAGESYEEQLLAVMSDFYVQADSYTYHLVRQGYECIEIIANIEVLQRSWCNQNGIDWSQEDFVRRLPIEQLRRFSPDVLFVNNFRIFDGIWLAQLREICPTLKFVMGWCGVGLESYASLSAYDCVLTCNRHLAFRMRRDGICVHVVPFGFDRRALDRIRSSDSKKFDITFAGSLQQVGSYHDDRAVLLEQVAGQLKLDVFTDSCDPPTWEILGRMALYDLAVIAKRLNLSSVLRAPGLRQAATWEYRPRLASPKKIFKGANPGVYGIDYLQVLHESKTTINVHPNCAGAAASNIRLFEATGVGTCLVTDWKEDIIDFFEPDREIVTFRSPDECISKLRWLLDQPKEREMIAAAGQRRTLQTHSYEKTAERLDDIIKLHFKL